MIQVRKKYSQNFKNEVSSLVVDYDRDVKELSEELNIPERVILKWVKDYEKRIADLVAENERLAENIKRLKEENKILRRFGQTYKRSNK